MPSSNQGQRRNDGPDKNNATGAQPLRDKAEAMAKQAQSGAEQVGNRLKDGFDTAKDEASRHLRHAEGAVARNPSSSVLIGFGLGFGLGVMLTSMIARREETWSEKYLPDSLRDLPNSLRDLHVPDRMSKAASQVPDSVHQTFHTLAESIRDLPSTLSRYVPHR